MSLNIIKDYNGTELVIQLIGTIEESVDFEKIIGPLPAELCVNTKGVSRINSDGVKAWIGYFQGARTRSTRLRFVECSIAIVHQINMISNFTCGGAVESVYVPFVCTGCKKELIALFKTESLKARLPHLPEPPCPGCGRKAEFDDIPEQYFRFLKRSESA